MRTKLRDEWITQTSNRAREKEVENVAKGFSSAINDNDDDGGGNGDNGNDV